MNFVYSLQIEHFIDMEIFLAIRHDVMFMRDEDFSTCKFNKSGDPTGGGRRGLTLKELRHDILSHLFDGVNSVVTQKKCLLSTLRKRFVTLSRAIAMIWI